MDLFTAIWAVFIFIMLYFQVFLLITFLENKANFPHFNHKNKPLFFDNFPSVTIIVPCWNEESTIAKTLHSLLSLEYPKDKLFISVIDDGSTDNTAKKIKPFLSNKQLQYFYKENGGKYTALNLGIQLAKTDLVGCLDADSFVSKKALLFIIKEFLDPEVMAVTPVIKINNPQTIIQRMQETEYIFNIFLSKLLAILGAQCVTPGPFSIYRRDIFNIIGLFRSAHNTEDMEMAMRMQFNRMKITNAFNAEVYTNSPKTFKALVRQRLRWTYGFSKNIIDYRSMIFKKRYNNVGMLTMPASLISLIALVYMIFYVIHGLIISLQKEIAYLSIMGMPRISSYFQLNWFFINTEMTVLLSYFNMITFLIFLTISIYYVRGRLILKKSDVYYVLLYGLVASVWVLKTVIQFVVRKPTMWK